MDPKKNFGPKLFLTQNYFGLTKFLVPYIFGPNFFFIFKLFLDLKSFLVSEKFYGPTIALDPHIFADPTFLNDQKKFVDPIFYMDLESSSSLAKFIRQISKSKLC